MPLLTHRYRKVFKYSDGQLEELEQSVTLYNSDGPERRADNIIQH